MADIVTRERQHRTRSSVLQSAGRVRQVHIGGGAGTTPPLPLPSPSLLRTCWQCCSQCGPGRKGGSLIWDGQTLTRSLRRGLRPRPLTATADMTRSASAAHRVRLGCTWCCVCVSRHITAILPTPVDALALGFEMNTKASFYGLTLQSVAVSGAVGGVTLQWEGPRCSERGHVSVGGVTLQ